MPPCCGTGTCKKVRGRGGGAELDANGDVAGKHNAYVRSRSSRCDTHSELNRRRRARHEAFRQARHREDRKRPPVRNPHASTQTPARHKSLWQWVPNFLSSCSEEAEKYSRSDLRGERRRHAGASCAPPAGAVCMALLAAIGRGEAVAPHGLASQRPRLSASFGFPPQPCPMRCDSLCEAKSATKEGAG